MYTAAAAPVVPAKVVMPARTKLAATRRIVMAHLLSLK
jgi:hypothetical protein